MCIVWSTSRVFLEFLRRFDLRLSNQCGILRISDQSALLLIQKLVFLKGNKITIEKNQGLESEIAPTVEVRPALDKTPSDGVKVTQAGAVALSGAHPPFPLSKGQRLIKSSTTGKGYIELQESSNPFVVPTDSKHTESLIHEAAASNGKRLNRTAVSDIKYYLQSNAERIGVVSDIWYRVAPVPGGIEIDLGDAAHTRVRITAGLVEIVSSGSTTLFERGPLMLGMAMPAEIGDVSLLRKYVNLHPVSFVLWLAWVTYTLATPKRASAKYVILVLQAGEGSGKSMLAKLTLRLIDPSQVDVRRMPKSDSDFAVAAQLAHVLGFDNLRFLSHDETDRFCVASTGGSISRRALYTDAGQIVLSLHVAVILNGIPSLVDQPDFAQRTLQLRLPGLPDGVRRSEDEMNQDLNRDLPAIQRGLFELIAKIFEQLPKVQLTRPARMIDFLRWLAAMEIVDGAPQGAYQEVYWEVLNEAQLNSVLDNPLASEILKFAETLPDNEKWAGTPSDLLARLNIDADPGLVKSSSWPGNAISLSKRLLPLQTALRSQGVALELFRGKHRTIQIGWVDGFERDASANTQDHDGFY